MLRGLEVPVGLRRRIERERPVDDGAQLVDRDGLHETFEVLARTYEDAAHHRELRHERVRAQIALGPCHDADDADSAAGTHGEIRLRQRAHATRVDDVIGTLAHKGVAAGWEVAIVSGDLDMLQLVNPKVTLLHTAKGGADAIVAYDEARVTARYGLVPAQMVDFKSLKGDPSDNIPGVPSVGEKTAAKLIGAFGSLVDLYRRLDEVEPERIRNSLRDHRAEAFAGQGLMTIDCDAPIELPASGGEIGSYDRDRALALFRELEFRALLQRLPPLVGEDRERASAAIRAATASASLRGEGGGSRTSGADGLTPKRSSSAVPADHDLQLGFDFDAVSAGNSAAGRSAPRILERTASAIRNGDLAGLSSRIEAAKRG